MMVSYELPIDCQSGIFWIVEPGDTIYAIAQETGFSIEEILQVNPNIDPDNLLIGSKICLPESSIDQIE